VNDFVRDLPRTYTDGHVADHVSTQAPTARQAVRLRATLGVDQPALRRAACRRRVYNVIDLRLP
jgi:hypothetical protein